MNKIGYKGLIKLLKGCNSSLQGYFPAIGAKGSEPWESSGCQIIFLHKIPLKAGKVKVDERYEWHTVTFGNLSEAPPELYMQASYGTKDALLALLEIEIATARKRGATPRMRAERAFWNGEERSHVTVTVKAGAGCNHDLHGPVVQVTFCEADMYLHLADFTFELAAKWRAARWARPDGDGVNEKADEAHLYYEFDGRHDAAKVDQLDA